jgi:hypothetical protein
MLREPQTITPALELSKPINALFFSSLYSHAALGQSFPTSLSIRQTVGGNNSTRVLRSPLSGCQYLRPKEYTGAKPFLSARLIPPCETHLFARTSAHCRTVVRSSQPIRITMRPAKLHPDTKVRRESSRRVRGLEYLRDHDEGLIARFYKQNGCALFRFSPTGRILKNKPDEKIR